MYSASNSRYNATTYRRCGKSGIKLAPISLGLWHNFGHVDHYANAKKMIHSAFDLGITHFDLANNYGPPPGTAEENFGKVLKEGIGAYRDEMIISTKAGYLMWPGPYGEWGSRKYLIASLDQSLKRMGLDYVDIFYHHRPDPNTPLEESMGALDHIVKQGKALYVGLSNYNAADTLKATKILHKLGTPCLIHQPRYNMMDRWVENELLDVLEDKGVGCIPFSPLEQGILTNRYLNGIPEDSRAAGASIFLRKEKITAELVSKIQKLNTIALRRGQSLAQMAVAWLLKDERITSVLVGVSSVEQLKDNLKAAVNTEFTTQELQEIDTILK